MRCKEEGEGEKARLGDKLNLSDNDKKRSVTIKGAAMNKWGVRWFFDELESLTRRGRQEEVFGDRGTTAGSQLLDSRWEKKEEKEKVGGKYLSSEVRKKNELNEEQGESIIGWKR